MDEGAGAGDHGGFGAVGARDAGQPRFGFAVVALAHAHDGDEAGVAEHVDAGIGEFERTAVGIAVHGLELVLGHLLHPHAARMKGEALGLDAFAGPEHRRDFGFHGGVRARDDLADAEIRLGGHFETPSVLARAGSRG
jgi:hypothetical protein